MYHVVTMDNYKAGPFKTIKEALRWCQSSTPDPRKHPRVVRHPYGIEFIEHRDPDRVIMSCFTIVDDKHVGDWPKPDEWSDIQDS